MKALRIENHQKNAPWQSATVLVPESAAEWTQKFGESGIYRLAMASLPLLIRRLKDPSQKNVGYVLRHGSAKVQTTLSEMKESLQKKGFPVNSLTEDQIKKIFKVVASE